MMRKKVWQDEAAWAAEIKRRVEDIQSGADKGVPAAQVMQEARRALHEKPARKSLLQRGSGGAY
jgi:hypothetical protein